MALRVTPLAGASRATVTRHASALGRWEIAVARSAPELRPYVRAYIGWFEQMASPLVRRELPTDEAPLIFNLGAPIRLFDLRDPRRHRDVGSFITGAYDTAQLVGSDGPSGGVQLNLSLLGIRRLVGRPLADMANQAIALEDVFGRDACNWSDQLADAPTWDARFELVDALLRARLAQPSDIPAGVRCAWHRLRASGGRTPIGSVVEEVGWSQRHLIDRFRRELGISPKVFARILRFAGVVRTLKAAREPIALAELALSSGYYDQSHLNRDVREFAGTTPAALAASLLPDAGGFVA